MSTPLTPRQEAFATGVAAGYTQAEAYRQAYPKANNWKDETVWKRASELAGNRAVQGRVKELQEKAAAANEVTIERIVAELAKLAFGDPRRLMSWGPDGVKLRPSSELTDDAAAAVAEVSETFSATGGSLKVKTADKVKALELLGRHLGIFLDKSELTGKDGAPLMPEGGVLLVPAGMTVDQWEKAATKPTKTK